MGKKNVLKNMNLFVDGKGQAGKVTELTLPVLSLLMEEFKAGGMDAPLDIEMGQEKMEATLILIDYNQETLALWGVAAGNKVPFVARGATQDDDGAVKTVKVDLRGKITKVDEGTWKPGESAKLTYTVAVNYYKKEVDGTVVTEIDVENMVRKVNGEDQLQEVRNALGL